MEERLCSFETSMMAKEKGFNIPQRICCVSINGQTYHEIWTDSIVDTDEVLCYQPTQTILQKWLREQHSIEAYALPSYTDNGKYVWEVLKQRRLKTSQTSITKSYFDTYEDALEEGLKEGLKLI